MASKKETRFLSPRRPPTRPPKNRVSSSEEDSDLEAWKVYQIIPDTKADEVVCRRVIDESGEDYLYPQSHFVRVELPPEAPAKLLAAKKN
ncbi:MULTISPECIES: hypothetical protein [Planktothricoides]|uniref:Uncharacterized protein n=2 Tax=Planktothricoides raciborskii TaxID=132608 RepID=A0AAU8JJC6_9CYAN|nr:MULTISPECIES: hypothetical protein [Planktothricoides]KOR34069.1 hypothetical protein AM228_26090 [Planktothricoides sp. SR001]MBD2547413.1 hypothetical protein [Planktothricoides raciborskii FACHB-1370]MBD2584541.1 hypothetical protein [Planktothricoides raciborskii FACHB-1261]